VARPREEPIGLYVTRTARALSRAFEEALAEAGGTLPTWLILVSLKAREWATQRELAQALGIEGATLTHHLHAMEEAGLVKRMRDPTNRRVQRVELTKAGDAAFMRLREVAAGFDGRLRSGLRAGEVKQLRELLGRLHANVAGGEENETR
jgi:MarR family transcriptional regulator, transcriptional regulator for hemolysin